MAVMLQYELLGEASGDMGELKMNVSKRRERARENTNAYIVL